MSLAKLFLTLAVLELGLAPLTSPYDIHFGRIRLQILLALVSGCFALIYFGASRMPRPLNHYLGLTHFVMTSIGISAVWATFFAFKSEIDPYHRWMGLNLLIGILCWLLGCVTLAVNCTWTAVAVVRSHIQANS
jgi:hypothetical protein